MVGDHHWNVAPVVPFSAHSGHALFSVQHSLGGRASQQADRLGFYGLKLAIKELAADFHLVRFRRSILRRPALHYVTDINVGTLDWDAFLGRRAFDHLGEQLSRAANERQPLRILVGARAFADEHELCFTVARSEDDLMAGFVEAAALAIADIPEDR